MTPIPEETLSRNLPKGTPVPRLLTCPLPGLHGSSVEASGGKHSRFAPVAKLARRLAENLLLERGTILQNARLLTDQEACELYAEVKLALLLSGTQPNPLSKFLEIRRLQIPNPCRDSAILVNPDHLSRLHRLYPRTFQDGTNSGGSDPSGLIRERQVMQKENPLTLRLLDRAANQDTFKAVQSSSSALRRHMP